ncbi:ARHGB factor, partial [Hylia prasina]|nr:ARHGB factor [Hylia prasina]
LPLTPVTPPFPLQDPEVQRHAAQILRNMLRQEEAELQRFQELLQRNPGAAVEEQLEGARRRLSQLQLKILQESQGSAPCDSQGSPFPFLLSQDLGSASGSPKLPGRFSRDSQDGEAGLESGPGEGSGRPQIIGPEEDCEPGCASNESDSLFQDLGILKSRPAHLGVFLRFLFSQADPTPLLFHLCSEVCCQQSNPKDSRALGRDIWNIFLDRSAVRAGIPIPV